MIHVSHKTLLFLSALVWLLIGIFLLSLGIGFVLSSLHTSQNTGFSLLNSLDWIPSSPQNKALFLITGALFVGYLKGRVVLEKSVKKQVARISGLPEPAPLTSLYSKGYFILIGGMIALGMCLRYLPITSDSRGAIDIAIGIALIRGAQSYLRHALSYISKPNVH